MPMNRQVKLARRPGWEGLVAKASDLDGAIRDLYGRPGTILAASALRMLGRLSTSAEVWLAARLLGHPISIVDALLLRSFAIVARAVAFPVPGGLGVQEGSFVALGALIGMPPDVALATSFAGRVREIVSGVPGLLVWQYVEGRGLWRGGNAAPTLFALTPTVRVAPVHPSAAAAPTTSGCRRADATAMCDS